MKKFEYLLVDTSSGFFSGFNFQQLNEHLNALGVQGWEVVTATGLDVGTGRTARILFTLKRELPLG